MIEPCRTAVLQIADPPGQETCVRPNSARGICNSALTCFVPFAAGGLKGKVVTLGNGDRDDRGDAVRARPGDGVSRMSGVDDKGTE